MANKAVKIYETFMVNLINPLASNEKLVLLLAILAMGGGLYTAADFLGLTHATHVDEETNEVHIPMPDRPLFLAPSPTVGTVTDLPYADEKHEHDGYALRNHTHAQKNWVPIIKKSDKATYDKLFNKYHK